jgi:hypothetical protein
MSVGVMKDYKLKLGSYAPRITKAECAKLVVYSESSQNDSRRNHYFFFLEGQYIA